VPKFSFFFIVVTFFELKSYVFGCAFESCWL
jgi:hypothetical protein